MSRGSSFARRLAAAAISSAIAVLAVAPAARADVTLTPATPGVGNCFVFGYGLQDEGSWSQAGYVYKNVPPFNLPPGGRISFDLGVENDVDIEFDIELAQASNGTDVPAGPFTKIVNNTQKAAAPRGNNVVGDYELAFTSQTQFTFPGGGLIVRFSNPSALYQTDETCTGNLVYADSTDTSGFFLSRFYTDPDGLPPYFDGDDDAIAAVRFTDGPRVKCGGRDATIVGTLGPETLRGTAGADVIAAFDGADTVSGGKGKDVICGGLGKDRLFGGAGKDRLFGEGGKDTLRGGKGKDKLKGGAGKDSERQ